MAHTIGTFSRSVRLVSRTTLQQAMRTRAPVARTLAARAQPAGSSTSVFASALVPVAGVVAAGLAYAWTLQDEHGAEAETIVERVAKIDARLKEVGAELVLRKNKAFVFIKPHAVTDKVKALVAEDFAARGITIVTEGELKSDVIDEKQLIDQHYYAIASKATILKPAQLNVPADKFKGKFGLEWADALASGRVLNAADGCKELGVDSEGLNELWGAAAKAKQIVKFGGGFYCGKIDVPGKEPLYIFNGFFMSMRSQFTAPGTSIYYYVVEWEADKLSWESFRGEVLGPTNPADAPPTSLRGMIMERYAELGLKSKPYTGENGMHASASPFEALAERMNWLETPVEDDDFGRVLMDAGISKATIEAWAVDPQVVLEPGTKGSIFDALEDTNSTTCADTLVGLNALN